MKYDFKKIESKWQKKWEKEKVFEIEVNSKKKKYYVLEMFPYPSGEGLHMGHALNYIIGDIKARFMRMLGFNVLYPMGYDSFGLPAENAAINAKTHPRKYTENAIKNFIQQQNALGLSYDWSKMIKTSSPEYYKWNQFFFLKFLEKGLVYRKKAPVNWCSKCETVLANEQVHDGKCWRHTDTEVETKLLEQWFIKTTDYAEELLDKVDDLEWPQRIKTMQKNWIGKSYGTEIDFEVEKDEKISNVVIVHGSNNKDKEKLERGFPQQNERNWIPWIKNKIEENGIKCFNPLMPENWNPIYRDWKKEFEKIKVNENSILVGHSSGGGFLVRWLGETKKKIKKLILVAPAIIHGEYINPSELLNFEIDKEIKNNIGEIILITSSDDSEGLKEAGKIFEDRLGIKPIVLEKRGHFVQKTPGEKMEFFELLNEIISKEKFPIFTTRPDTIYGVTFMVMSAQHQRLMEFVSSKQKKEVEKFLKKIKSVSDKDADKLDKEGVFTGSYAINPLTKEKVPIYAGNFVVADYGSGMVMAVPAHDQRDFLFAKKYNIPIKVVIKPKDYEVYERGGQIPGAYTGEGALINSEGFNDLQNVEAKDKITKFLKKKKLGRKVVQYKLRDWLVSRQRYWGTPIPIIYCDKCGVVPIPEKDLPVLLPEKVKFGKGNPLLSNKKFVDVKCPKCGAKARRETDTMDTFFDSSWYYLRYPDSENEKKSFEKKNVDYWLPVDQYIGGAEHACMHLIYARFFTKALRDLGFVDFDEPFTKLFNQGMLHASDGNKMSKSLGNVINPLDIIEKNGADALRFALMSFASPDSDTNWDEKVLAGSYKFLNKVWDYFESVKIGKADSKTESKLNKIIKEVTNQIENFKYNLAIIKVRELFNSLPQETSKEVLEKSLKLLHPFCPHITEELYAKIGSKKTMCLSEWPKVEEKKIDDSLDKQEEMVENLIKDINNISKLVEGKKKVYVYVLPNEKGVYFESLEEIKKRTGLEIEIFAVNDKDKYDPENKSKKVKPGRPGIYFK